MLLTFNVDEHALTYAIANVIAELSDHVAPAVTDAAEDVAVTARQEHDYMDRTGALTRSIQAHPATGQLYGGSLEAEVSADAGHAAFVEFSTKAHRIPLIGNAKSMLRFIIGGRTIFAHHVQHPGTTAKRFLAKALQDEMPRTTETVLQGACDAFRAAGFVVQLL